MPTDVDNLDDRRVVMRIELSIELDARGTAKIASRVAETDGKYFPGGAVNNCDEPGETLEHATLLLRKHLTRLDKLLMQIRLNHRERLRRQLARHDQAEIERAAVAPLEASG